MYASGINKKTSLVKCDPVIYGLIVDHMYNAQLNVKMLAVAFS